MIIIDPEFLSLLPADFDHEAWDKVLNNPPASRYPQWRQRIVWAVSDKMDRAEQDGVYYSEADARRDVDAAIDKDCPVRLDYMPAESAGIVEDALKIPAGQAARLLAGDTKPDTKPVKATVTATPATKPIDATTPVSASTELPTGKISPEAYAAFVEDLDGNEWVDETKADAVAAWTVSRLPANFLDPINAKMTGWKCRQLTPRDIGVFGLIVRRDIAGQDGDVSTDGLEAWSQTVAGKFLDDGWKRTHIKPLFELLRLLGWCEKIRDAVRGKKLPNGAYAKGRAAGYKMLLSDEQVHAIFSTYS